MKFVMTLICLGFLTACGDLNNSEDRPSYDALKNNVNAHREKWQSLDIQNYAYHLEKNCFCDRTNFLINVKQGNIEVVVSYPGSDREKIVMADSDDDILTIEQLFTRALEWADKAPDQLDVTFDPTYFVVTKLFMDRRDGMADDEIGIKLSRFSEVLD